MKNFREFVAESMVLHESELDHAVGDHVHQVSSSRGHSDTYYHGRITKVNKSSFKVKWATGRESNHRIKDGKSLHDHNYAQQNIEGGKKVTGKELAAIHSKQHHHGAE